MLFKGISYLELRRPLCSAELNRFSVGAKSQIKSSVAPQEENFGHYFQSGTCLGALETHVLPY